MTEEQKQSGREIKFRGKSKMTDDRRMVYGYGCYTDRNDRYFILIDDEVGFMRPIQVESIEEFTGLKDKNGKEIYEGDLLMLYGTRVFQSSVRTQAEVKWFNFGWKIYELDIDEMQPLKDEWSNHCEVIGNIYEDSELISNPKKDE